MSGGQIAEFVPAADRRLEDHANFRGRDAELWSASRVSASAAAQQQQDPRYNRADWMNNWRAFDANGDGCLSSDEYWSAPAWTRLDRNGDGRIDANEWTYAP